MEILEETLNEIADLVFAGRPSEANQLYKELYASLNLYGKMRACEMLGKIKQERFEQFRAKI